MSTVQLLDEPTCLMLVEMSNDFDVERALSRIEGNIRRNERTQTAHTSSRVVGNDSTAAGERVYEIDDNHYSDEYFSAHRVGYTRFSPSVATLRRRKIDA